jgi:hypothetical protein
MLTTSTINYRIISLMYCSHQDPAGIKALLDQLRASQAWQESNTGVNATQADENPSVPSQDSPRDPSQHVPELLADLESPPAVSSHISSLLSQLQPGASASSSLLSEDLPKAHAHRRAHQAVPSSPPKIVDSGYNFNSTIHRPPPTQKKSLRTLPFIQALPVVAKLAEDPKFMESLEKVLHSYPILMPM